MKKHRISLLSSKWIISSILAAVITLLIYETIHQPAFPIVVDEKNGVLLEACFTTGSDCQGKIIHAINEAKEDIIVMSYFLAARPIAEALVKAHQRGVKVFDLSDYKKRECEPVHRAFLATQNVPITFDKTVAISHNKVMIIDGRTVITDSYKGTNAARYSNAENFLFIESPLLAKQYKTNWETRMAAAQKDDEVLTIRKWSFSNKSLILFSESVDRSVDYPTKKHLLTKH